MPRGSAAGRKVIHLAGVEGALLPHDPRWEKRAVVEVVTAAYDDDALGVGTSPYRGDLSTTGLRVPALASTPDDRYLFRLAAAVVSQKRSVVLRGIRTLVTMRQEYLDEATHSTFVFEREVESPLWNFRDGNVSFHLRWSYPSQARRFAADADPAHLPAMSPSSWGLDSALLYAPPAAVYTPLGGGIPPGRGVDYLGTWRDNRFPWHRTSWDLQIPIIGPGVVTLYASVKQTNPTTRPQMPVFMNPVTDGWRVEDQFLLQHTQAVYGHVAGALTLELFPDTKDMT